MFVTSFHSWKGFATSLRLLTATTAACLLMLSLFGCASSGNKASSNAGSGTHGTGRVDSTTNQSNAADASWPAASRTLAYVAGQPVSAGEMFPRLLSYAGGQALSQIILDKQIDRQLGQRRLIISPDLIEAEKQELLSELSSDPDEAVRLLKDLRQSRGVTNDRFNQTLRRNAALRALTREQVNVTDQDLLMAFDIQHGDRYEARIITTQTLGQMKKIIAQLGQGASFIDLAIASSTDTSSAQGGLMPLISGADPSYPAAVRNVLVALKPGEVSHPIALDNNYAILKLERKIDGDNVKFDDVKKALTLSVQRQQQQTQMRLLARTLLQESDVVVLDPVLKESWDRQKAMMNQDE